MYTMFRVYCMVRDRRFLCTVEKRKSSFSDGFYAQKSSGSSNNNNNNSKQRCTHTLVVSFHRVKNPPQLIHSHLPTKSIAKKNHIQNRVSRRRKKRQKEYSTYVESITYTYVWNDTMRSDRSNKNKNELRSASRALTYKYT